MEKDTGVLFDFLNDNYSESMYDVKFVYLIFDLLLEFDVDFVTAKNAVLSWLDGVFSKS